MKRMLLAILVAAGAGCPVTADPLCERDVCTAVDSGQATPIDKCIDTPTAAECLDDTAAIFVDVARANDASADGTRARPYGNLKLALDRITATRRRVYVCEGRYVEKLVLEARHERVSIIGGMDCSWKASTNRPVIGTSPEAAVVVGVRGVALASVDIEASDNATGSSVALLAASAEVTLKNVRLVAGAGGPGVDGTLVPHTYPASSLLQGKTPAPPVAAAEVSYNACPGANATTTVGGRGGAPGFNGGNGTPMYGTGGAGGTTSVCNMGGDGVNGDNGPNGKDGDGAMRPGDFVERLWTPARGADGENGRVGQGGGGGGGNGGFYAGGGGAGGCGGAGGSGGSGGGGSIALASVFATINATSTAFVTKSGGNGGNGASGQAGQSGGTGGAGENGPACDGATGGRGGNGGAGGGGAGGVSVGVLYKGTAPTLTLPEFTRGAGGRRGLGANGNNGADGVSVDVLPL